MKNILIWFYRAIPAIVLIIGTVFSPNHSIHLVSLLFSISLVFPIIRYEDKLFPFNNR